MSRGAAAVQVLAVAVALTSGCGRLGFDEIASEAPRDASTVDADIDAGEEDLSTFSSLCTSTTHVIIQNGIAVDDNAGDDLSDSIIDGCSAGATPQLAVSQDDPGYVDQATGRPLVAANELVVLGGGDGPHDVVRYFLQTSSPLVWAGTNPVTITERASGRVIAMGSSDSANDYLMIQVFHEPIGDTMAVSIQGIVTNGTIAAAVYVKDVIPGELMTTTAQWMVLRWADDDGMAGPTATDTFTLIESG